MSLTPLARNASASEAPGAPTHRVAERRTRTGATAPAARWLPVMSAATRDDLWKLTLLSCFATVPLAGILPVAMANDSGQASRTFVRGQQFLLPYSMACSAVIGLALSPLVVPGFLGAALVGETVGRLPLRRAVAA